jgi:hypothetical protein
MARAKSATVIPWLDDDDERLEPKKRDRHPMPVLQEYQANRVAQTYISRPAFQLDVLTA